MSDTRQISSCAFCWQDKAVLRKLEETFSESNRVASARSVYLALSQLASDYQAEEFEARIALVAHKAGVSVRTAAEVLKNLEGVGLLQITRKKLPGTNLDGPSTYSLLSLGNDCLPLGNGCGALGNGPEQTSVSDKVEESKKNLIEESKKNSASRFSPPSLEAVKLHAAKIGLLDSEAEKFFHFYESKGWKVGKSPMKSWQSAMAGWKVRWETNRSDRSSSTNAKGTSRQDLQSELNQLRADYTFCEADKAPAMKARIETLRRQLEATR